MLITGPLISLSMGEKGVISRLLATKYGGYLTFATTSSGKESAPGQPSLESLKHMYRSDQQTASSKVFGIIGNPVSHSRSPVLHNTAMHHLGLNSVFVPLLVDDMDSFCETFTDNDWHGFCVTIPHKVCAPIKAVPKITLHARSARLFLSKPARRVPKHVSIRIFIKTPEKHPEDIPAFQAQCLREPCKRACGCMQSFREDRSGLTWARCIKDVFNQKRLQYSCRRQHAVLATQMM